MFSGPPNPHMHPSTRRLRVRANSLAARGGPASGGMASARAVELKQSISAIQHEISSLNRLARLGLKQAIMTINTVGNLVGDAKQAPVCRERVVRMVLDLIRPIDGPDAALPRISVVGATPTPAPGAYRVPVWGVGGVRMADLPSVDRDDVQCLESKHALLLDHRRKHENAIELLRIVVERGTVFLELMMANGVVD